MEKNHRTKLLIWFITIVFMFSIAGITGLFGIENKVSAAIVSSQSLIKTEGCIGAFTDDGEYFRVEATAKGQSFSFKKAYVGDLEFDLIIDPVGVQNFEIELTDLVDGEKFAIGIMTVSGRAYAYVDIAGERYARVKGNETDKFENYNGIYTDLGQSQSKRVSILYNHVTGSVTANGQQVWNVKEPTQYGYKDRSVIRSIVYYSINCVFVDTIDADAVLLVSLGDILFTRDLPNDSPAVRIAAEVTDNAVANEPYEIPVPYAVKPESGDINANDVNVKVSRSGSTLVSKAYETGMTFTPTAVGTYNVEYTATNDDGVKTAVSYRVKVVKTAQAEYAYLSDNTIPDSVGLNAVVTLPAATVASNLKAESTAYINVYYNGTAVEGYENVSAATPNRITLTKEGEYKIVYSDAGNDLVPTDEFTVNVSADMIACVCEGSQSLLVNQTYNVSSFKAYLGSEETDGEFLYIETPSGIRYYTDMLVVKEIGTYKTVYAFTLGGNEYVYAVETKATKNVVDLFDAGKSKIEYKISHMSDGLKGVEVTSAAGQTITLNQVVNLKNLGKDTPIIEAIATPSQKSQAEFRELFVRLTDIYDENNFIEVRLMDAGPANSTQITYITARHSGVGESSMGGWEDLTWAGVGWIFSSGGSGHVGGSTMVHSYWGECSFDNIMTFSYDYDKMQVLNPRTRSSTNIVATMNDLNCFRTIWDGFTTGEVKISIKTTLFEASSAKYMITSIAGIDLTSEKIADNVAPVVDVELPEIMPKAEVGKPFKVFDAVGYDHFDKNVKLQVRVYSDYSAGIETGYYQGTFTPTDEGTYVIEYIATDAAGNVGVKTIEVAAQMHVDVVVDAIADAETMVNKKFVLPIPAISGGVGNYSIKTTITDLETHENVETVDSFTPSRAGEYEVSVCVSDYVGNKAEVNYTLYVVTAEFFAFEKELVLNPAFIAGESTELPTIIGLDYSLADPAPVTGVPKAYIGSEELEITDGRYITVDADKEGLTVRVEYTFTNSRGNDTVLTATAPVVAVKGNNGYENEKYFVTEGVKEIKKDSQKVTYVMNSADNEFKFIKALPVQSISMKFSLQGEAGAIDRAYIRFTDSEDAGISVCFAVYRNTGNKLANYSRATMNGGDYVSWTGSFYDPTQAFEIRYDVGDNTFYDGVGKSLGYVNYTENGETFNGFTGGSVYVTMWFEGSFETDCSVSIYQVANQSFNNANFDLTNPIVLYDKNFFGSLKIGSVFTVPAASAFDVLSEIEYLELTVSVMGVDGKWKVVKDVDGTALKQVNGMKEWSFEISENGNYKVFYEASDGRNTESSQFILYTDNQFDVSITLNGNVPVSAKVGDIIKLPTASSNADSGKSYIVVQCPTGEIKNLKETEFTAKEVGIYVVTYVKYDVYYNMTVQSFTIAVK
ncbi:MAG: hypothetical protein J5697_00025 [Clostridia bacterium]|nr:hypothetical protein [Clostridia bacterium]